MARLKEGHVDQYEAGTRQERGYICNMSSIYKDDCITDAAILAANVINKSMIAKKGDDTEFELGNFE